MNLRPFVHLWFAHLEIYSFDPLHLLQVCYLGTAEAQRQVVQFGVIHSVLQILHKAVQTETRFTCDPQWGAEVNEMEVSVLQRLAPSACRSEK